MKLSENFNLHEFTKSQVALRNGFNNNPGNDEIENLRRLCVNVLQPVRNALGPVFVSSGYRSKEVNDFIKGSERSQHMFGQAADIEIFSMSNMDLANWICDNIPSFDQLILEFHEKDKPNSGWVHVSFVSLSVNRKHYFRID